MAQGEASNSLTAVMMIVMSIEDAARPRNSSLDAPPTPQGA
jgi:hypothetical protein